MLIRILDLENFDKTLDVMDRLTIGELRDMIESNFDYDLSYSTFYHHGVELPVDFKLQPERFADSNVIVLFNFCLFPQKSYPKVDRAFHFFPSRFQEHYFVSNHAEELESSGEQRSRRRYFHGSGADASALAANPGADFPLHHHVRRPLGRLANGPRPVEVERFEFDLFPEAVEDGNGFAFEDGPVQEVWMDLH
jgi:hypothetical protein